MTAKKTVSFHPSLKRFSITIALFFMKYFNYFFALLEFLFFSSFSAFLAKNPRTDNTRTESRSVIISDVVSVLSPVLTGFSGFSFCSVFSVSFGF